jgi:hypothetical protein
MTFTEELHMHTSKRRPVRLVLAALGFLLACGDPTAPAASAAKNEAPIVRADANLVDVVNGLFKVTNGVTTLLGDLLPCNVTSEQWNTASIGPRGGTLEIGPHQLVIPAGALARQTQITAHAVRGNHVRVEFSPSGLQFNVPAALKLSYDVCKAPGKPVQVVYLKSDDKVTETEPSVDYPRYKYVQAVIRHFSSYAVAY